MKIIKKVGKKNNKSIIKKIIKNKVLVWLIEEKNQEIYN